MDEISLVDDIEREEFNINGGVNLAPRDFQPSAVDMRIREELMEMEFEDNNHLDTDLTQAVAETVPEASNVSDTDVVLVGEQTMEERLDTRVDEPVVLESTLDEETNPIQELGLKLPEILEQIDGIELSDEARKEVKPFSDALYPEVVDNSSELIKSVFKAEGGYSDDKKDTGNYTNNKTSGNFIGTNHGISAPLLKEYLGREPTVEDMKAVTKEEAAKIYKDRYFDKFGIGDLPEDLQEIVFHSVVNSGANGLKVVQDLVGVTADGVYGPNTAKAMKAADFTKKEFYSKLMEKYKTFKTWKAHGKGWDNRFKKLANKE